VFIINFFLFILFSFLKKIFQGEVVLERSYYLNKTEKNINILESLKNVYRNITTLIYGPIENIDEIINNELIFETKLAEISGILKRILLIYVFNKILKYLILKSQMMKKTMIVHMVEKH
jgi:hypothetical protein